MKKLLLGLLMLVAITAAQGQIKPAASRGGVYTQLSQLPSFKDYREQQSVMLEPEEDNHVLTLMASGSYRVLVLSQCLPKQAKAKYKLLDAVALGRIAADQKVVTTACGLNNKGDNNIIALVKADSKPFYKVVYKAWRVNRQTGRIQAISTKGIDCLNEGFDM